MVPSHYVDQLRLDMRTDEVFKERFNTIMPQSAGTRKDFVCYHNYFSKMELHLVNPFVPFIPSKSKREDAVSVEKVMILSLWIPFYSHTTCCAIMMIDAKAYHKILQKGNVIGKMDYYVVSWRNRKYLNRVKCPTKYVSWNPKGSNKTFYLFYVPAV